MRGPWPSQAQAELVERRPRTRSICWGKSKLGGLNKQPPHHLPLASAVHPPPFTTRFKPPDSAAAQIAAPQQAGSLLAPQAQKPNVNDAFSRMHEDPLLLIRQKQMNARESVVKNPLCVGSRCCGGAASAFCMCAT